MKLTVLGATGMAGRAITDEAAKRGHDVLAASRHPAPATDPRVGPRVLDLHQPGSALDELLHVDAVVASIRMTPGEEQRLAPITSLILDRAARTNTRVLIIGGAGPLQSPRDPDLLVLDDPDYVSPQWRDTAAASVEQYTTCVNHPFRNWIYVSPSAVFEPGHDTGAYRRGTTTLLTSADGSSRVTPADLALAVLDELEHPGDERHITVISQHKADTASPTRRRLPSVPASPSRHRSRRP